jgi:hypothetical protein
MKVVVWITSILGACTTGLAVAQPVCPIPNEQGIYNFPGGALGFRSGLNVNPDGTAGSYTPGNHGYTYIANGVNLIENGVKVQCSQASNTSNCNAKWALSEAGNFDIGTPEFCSFALAVDPFAPGQQLQICEDKRDRFVIGNGKGRPRMGPIISNILGGQSLSYVSNTALTQTLNGQQVPVDSAIVPAIVVPQARAGLLGSVAWVKYENNQTFAVVGDSGPKFGEGTIALNELLRYGSLQSFRSVGPIPAAQRCQQAELNLRAPFQSRPDLRFDECRTGTQAKSDSDIRAYGAISTGVVTIILPAARVTPQNSRSVQSQLNVATMRQVAASSGYSSRRLEQMASCVRRSYMPPDPKK